MIVLGSTASVLFINQNVATLDGGFSLEPSWVEGPYEAQSAQMANTPFAALSASLPGPGTGVTGVHVSSLPENAISYYEAEDVSVVFEIPMGQVCAASVMPRTWQGGICHVGVNVLYSICHDVGLNTFYSTPQVFNPASIQPRNDILNPAS
jgi:hypothetical protein